MTLTLDIRSFIHLLAIAIQLQVHRIFLTKVQAILLLDILVLGHIKVLQGTILQFSTHEFAFALAKLA